MPMHHATGKKLLGFWDLMSISLGQIIGTGVVVLTGVSISMTGYGAPWAFLLALAIVAIPTICIAALGSAVPSTGGNYTYVRDLLGQKTSFFYLSLLVVGQLILSSFAIGFAEYTRSADSELEPYRRSSWCHGAMFCGKPLWHKSSGPISSCYGARFAHLACALHYLWLEPCE